MSRMRLVSDVERGGGPCAPLDRTVEIVPGPVRLLVPAQIPLRAARGLVLCEARAAGHDLPSMTKVVVLPGDALRGSPKSVERVAR